MSLAQKLISGFVLCSLILVGVGVSNYIFMARMVESYDHVVEVNMSNERNLNEMYLSYRSVRISLRTLGLPGLTEAQRKESRDGVVAAIEAYEKADKEYVADGFEAGEEAAYSVVSTAWKSFKELGGHALALEATRAPDDQKKLMTIFLVDCPREAKAFDEAVIGLQKFLANRDQV